MNNPAKIDTRNPRPRRAKDEETGYASGYNSKNDDGGGLIARDWEIPSGQRTAACRVKHEELATSPALTVPPLRGITETVERKLKMTQPSRRVSSVPANRVAASVSAPKSVLNVAPSVSWGPNKTLSARPNAGGKA